MFLCSTSWTLSDPHKAVRDTDRLPADADLAAINIELSGAEVIHNCGAISNACRAEFDINRFVGVLVQAADS